MGGNINFKKVFDKETESILGLSAIKVQNEICKILDEHNIEYLRIGSVGHNRPEAMHSDIDVAIKTEAATKLYKRPILVTKQTLNQAANELRAQGLKFDFCGKEVPAQGDAVIPPLYSIYNNQIGEVL